MKILHQGTHPEKRLWKGECSHCKSVVQAEESELKVTSNQHDGELASASCPFCYRQMWFYPEKA